MMRVGLQPSIGAANRLSRCCMKPGRGRLSRSGPRSKLMAKVLDSSAVLAFLYDRSEEHTSELQSRRDLHCFPTRRSSDLMLHEARTREVKQERAEEQAHG